MAWSLLHWILMGLQAWEESQSGVGAGGQLGLGAHRLHSHPVSAGGLNSADKCYLLPCHQLHCPYKCSNLNMSF